MTLTGGPIPDQARTYVGRTVFDADHERLGEIDGLYTDGATGDLAWVSFPTDFLAERSAFVPAAQITPFSDGVSIPLDRATLRNMPRVHPVGGVLSGSDVARLSDFFGTSGRRAEPAPAHLVPRQRVP